MTGLSACSRSAGQAQPPRLHCWPCVAHPAAPHHLPPAPHRAAISHLKLPKKQNSSMPHSTEYMLAAMFMTHADLVAGRAWPLCDRVMTLVQSVAIPAVSCPQPSAGCLLSLQCGSSPASGLHLLPTRPEAGGTGLVLLTVSRMPAHLGCCCRACASWVVMGCLQVIVSSLSSV